MVSTNSRSGTPERSTNSSLSHFLFSFIALPPQNCERNRTSLSKIRRRSLMRRRPMAMRSRPMPKQSRSTSSGQCRSPRAPSGAPYRRPAARSSLAMAGGADLTGRLARAVALEALHVDLAAWLREREMMRAEAHDGVLAVQRLMSVSSAPFRSPIVMPSSTTRPSI